MKPFLIFKIRRHCTGRTTDSRHMRWCVSDGCSSRPRHDLCFVFLDNFVSQSVSVVYSVARYCITSLDISLTKWNLPGRLGCLSPLLRCAIWEMARGRSFYFRINIQKYWYGGGGVGVVLWSVVLFLMFRSPGDCCCYYDLITAAWKGSSAT